LTSVFDAGTPAVQWAGITYHPSGLWSTLLHANGVRDVVTLDPSVRTRPQRIHTENVVPAADNFDSGLMAYDGAGNLKAVGNSFYAYDEVDRIAASDMASPLGGNIQEEYTYDAFGNATIYDFTYPGPAPVDSSTNRLIESAFTVYDDAGNLLTHTDPLFGPWVWRYNALNKVTVQNSDQYAYDGFGERIVSFNEDGWNFHLRDPEARRLSSFLLNDGDWSRDDDFIYGGDRIVASSEHDFHHDHLGNVRLVTDPSAEALDTFTLTPFGVDVEHEPSGGLNPYTNVLFTGHERDWSTGADYLHARHYHQRLGRFTSVDPQRGSPDEPQSLNRYAYVLGRPLSRVDPTGRDDEPSNDIEAQPWEDYYKELGLTQTDYIEVLAEDPGPSDTQLAWLLGVAYGQQLAENRRDDGDSALFQWGRDSSDYRLRLDGDLNVNIDGETFVIDVKLLKFEIGEESMTVTAESPSFKAGVVEGKGNAELKIPSGWGPGQFVRTLNDGIHAFVYLYQQSVNSESPFPYPACQWTLIKNATPACR